MDPSSCSNCDEIQIKSFHWRVDVNFSTKKLLCCVELKAVVSKDGCSRLVSGVLLYSDVLSVPSGPRHVWTVSDCCG